VSGSLSSPVVVPHHSHTILATLSTWKLTPLKQPSPRWASSTYRGETYVRASSEMAARRFAAAQFARDPTKISPRSPWFFELFTLAEVVDDERFASITAPGVVYPKR